MFFRFSACRGGVVSDVLILEPEVLGLGSLSEGQEKQLRLLTYFGCSGEFQLFRFVEYRGGGLCGAGLILLYVINPGWTLLLQMGLPRPSLSSRQGFPPFDSAAIALTFSRSPSSFSPRFWLGGFLYQNRQKRNTWFWLGGSGFPY